MKRSITDYADRFPTVQLVCGHITSLSLFLSTFTFFHSSLLSEVCPHPYSARLVLAQMLPPMYIAIELYSYDGL